MTAYQHQYGEFHDPGQLSAAQGHACLRLDARQLRAQWRRNGLSADFVARYVSFSFPLQRVGGWLNREAAFHVFTYLLNELLENCAKFSGGENQAVILEAWQLSEAVVFQVSNHILPRSVAGFQGLIDTLLTGDLEELYFQKLEANAESDGSESGLGYLTLMKDYGIRFGFGFQTLGDDSVRVDVQALVSKKEI